MENLSLRQIVLIAALVSFLTGSFVSFFMISLYGSELIQPQLVGFIRNPIRSIIEPSDPPKLPEPTIQEKVVAQEEKVVQAVKKASPAVASIIATKDLPVIEQFYVNPFEGDPFFEQFFPDLRVPQFRQKGTEEKQISSGTGFIVSSDGLVVTNKHVVQDTEAHYTVLTNDGRKLAAKVLARDPLQDLAVLKVEVTNLPVVGLGDSDRLNAGQSVIAIGNALGEFRNTVSVGVISGLRRSIIAEGLEGGPAELRDIIQTDAAINPGNSGGPLLNLSGEVVGINTAMARGAENIGFAIPINKAKKAIADVKATGKITYPFLGVRYVIITPDLQKEKQLPVDFGALLSKTEKDPAVTPGSAAEQAGLKEGDIIIEFGGVKVDLEHPLNSLIADRRVKEKVKLKIQRSQNVFEVEVVLEERK